MENATFHAAPRQKAITQHEFDALALALNTPVELVNLLENLHRRSGWPLGYAPVFASCSPSLPYRNAIRIVGETYERILPLASNPTYGCPDGSLFEWVFPASLQPNLEFGTWVRWRCQLRSRDLKEVRFLFGFLPRSVRNRFRFNARFAQ